MSAKLDQTRTSLLRIFHPGAVALDVPPPVDYLGSNCPEYDQHVNALFFAPFSPRRIALARGRAELQGLIHKIRPDWTDSVWQASLRLK